MKAFFSTLAVLIMTCVGSWVAPDCTGLMMFLFCIWISVGLGVMRHQKSWREIVPINIHYALQAWSVLVGFVFIWVLQSGACSMLGLLGTIITAVGILMSMQDTDSKLNSYGEKK